MTKEKIPLQGIKQDLKKILEQQLSVKSDRVESFAFPIAIIAVIVGVITKRFWLGAIIFAPAVYLFVRFAIEFSHYLSKKKELMASLERAQLCVLVRKLSHITLETIYEPHVSSRGHTHAARVVKIFYFESSLSWREPLMGYHYEWSREMKLSPKGLDNVSVPGDEFYYISLQDHPEVAYIYPCKLFTLDESILSER